MTAPQDPFSRPADDAGGSAADGGYGTPQGGAPGYGPAPGGASFGQAPYGTPPGSGSVPLGAPGGYGGGPQLADWGTRAGGYLVDFGISFAAQFVVALFSQSLAQVVGIAVFLYFGYLTGTTGQTPGRRVVGIRVLREADGQVLGAGAGIGRGFLHILDALPLLLGFLWPIWDKKKQTFADKIIHSVVVKA
jgi:uncharacterized RDD family membrane protein YckC